MLLLFIAGATTRSRQAVLRIRELCAGPIKGRVKLKVIDLYQQPALARIHQIVATPTLVLVSPSPMRRFIGSLTNIADVFVELDVGARGRMFP